MLEPFNAGKITLDNWEGIFKCRRKPIIVHATQIDLPEGFSITVNGHIRTGEQGDYLLFNDMGEKSIWDREIFEQTYDIIGGGQKTEEVERLKQAEAVTYLEEVINRQKELLAKLKRDPNISIVREVQEDGTEIITIRTQETEEKNR